MIGLDVFKDYLSAEDLEKISGGAKSIKDIVVDRETHAKNLTQYLVNAAKHHGKSKEQFLAEMASKNLTVEANGITYEELAQLTEMYW